MAKRRPIRPPRRRRRPLLKLVLALAVCGVAFGASAVATFWIIERTQLLKRGEAGAGEGEELTPEERRILERIIRRATPEP